MNDKQTFQPDPTSKATILLLGEESVESFDFIKELINEGFEFKVAVGAEQAKKHVESTTIDLLIVFRRDCLSNEISSLRDLADVHLPVLVISDQLPDDVLDNYADVGIDAVISSPVNLRLLLIKIRSSLRQRQLYKLESEQRKQLQSYSALLKFEQEVAANIFNNILKSHLLEVDEVKAIISPMALFNGDLVLSWKTPDNHLHVLLGDFTGHGLSASIAATPVAEIFSGMTKKGFAIADIVLEINRKLYKMLPANIFLAATIISINPDAKLLGMITCGLPEHFLVDKARHSYKAIHSVNLPLGIQEEIGFKEQIFGINGSESLYLFTDGVFEAENAEGVAFGSQRIIDAIFEENLTDIENLQLRLKEHSGELNQQDDITFVKLSCEIENPSWIDKKSQPASQHMNALNWKSMLEFDISTLKSLNPVPLMVNALMEIQGLHDHRQAIFIIVNELFANALDHGLLEMDSNVKSSPDGFMLYYNMKDQLLQNCNRGSIRFLFSHKATESGGRLTIKVRDSGCGFKRQETSLLEENATYSGRGLKLLEALCVSLSYHGKGNQVTAVFDWNK